MRNIFVVETRGGERWVCRMVYALSSHNDLIGSMGVYNTWLAYERSFEWQKTCSSPEFGWISNWGWITRGTRQGTPTITCSTTFAPMWQYTHNLFVFSVRLQWVLPNVRGQVRIPHPVLLPPLQSQRQRPPESAYPRSKHSPICSVLFHRHVIHLITARHRLPIPKTWKYIMLISMHTSVKIAGVFSLMRGCWSWCVHLPWCLGAGAYFPVDQHQTECHDPLAAVRKERGEKIVGIAFLFFLYLGDLIPV